MNRLMRGWGPLLVGLVPVGLLLVGCSGAAGVSSEGGTATSQRGDPAAANLGENSASPSDASGMDLTINVDVADQGFQPSTIFIPAGRGVKLVVRNRGTSEHHYRVQGLVPEGLLWLAGPESERVEGVTDEDHELHHETGFMPFRAASPAGIRPLGDEVHAYATAGGVDVVLFTATNKGTFVVQCPLHPEMTGKVTVF